MNITLSWRKSRRSGTGDNCVEVAKLPVGTAVRDSKNPGGGHLTLDPRAAKSFADAVKAGQYDL